MDLSAWDLAAVAIKAIVYAATLCAAGGVFFLLYSATLLSSDQHHSIRRWVGLCIGVALVTSVIRIAVVAGLMGDGGAVLFDGAMMRMVLQAGEGRATGIRIVGLLLMGAVIVSVQRRSILASMGAVIAVTSFAWIGHAWAAHAGGLPIALLSLHLVGVAFWLGALPPLLLIARQADLPRMARTAARFGNVAVVVVGVLLVAGMSLLWILLGALSELWTSAYGRTIALKLGLVAGLLSLAAFNKLRLTPRLLAQDSRALLSLKNSIRFEVLLGSLILIVTAILTTLMGPRA